MKCEKFKKVDAKRSKNMSAIKSKDTKPELIVRQTVHRLGYRYRLHRKDLPGKPDLVFGPRKKIIFVNGCFWHQHDNLNCKIARRPKSNTGYWNAKLERNVQRDKSNQQRLIEMGWEILVIWECEIRNPAFLEMKIQEHLN